MARRSDNESLDEDPLESDQDDGDVDPELVKCGTCGEAVSELADVCPYCRSYVVVKAEQEARTTNVVIASIVLAVAMIICWAVFQVLWRRWVWASYPAYRPNKRARC